MRKRLKEARRAAGFTQRQMADKLYEYCSEEKYEKTMGSISDLWISLGKRIVNLENIQPETIEKKF